MSIRIETHADGKVRVHVAGSGIFDEFSGKGARARTRAHRSVADFLAQHDYSAHGRGLGGTIPKKAWVFWAQGFDQAPPVVRRCMNSIRWHCQDSELIELTSANIADHVTLPDHILQHKGITHTHLSDILRVSLLARHGGTWIDATCLLTQPLGRIRDIVLDTDNPEAYSRSNFFVFSLKNFISNWFMMSSAGHILPMMLRDYLCWYWSHTETVENYHWFHMVFRAMYFQNAQFRSVWDRTVRLGSGRAHFLQRVLDRPHDKEEMKMIWAMSPVHKLTYKHSPAPQAAGTYTYWDHVNALSKRLL